MSPHNELLQRIGIVRSRWKAFLWVRGLAWVLGVAVVSMLIGVALMNSGNISAWTVNGVRLGVLVAIVFTVMKALILPLRRPPTDAQLARFVEERNPGLEDRLVSAVEAIHKSKTEQIAFVHLLIKDALDRTKHLRFRDQVNKRKFSTFAGLTAG